MKSTFVLLLVLITMTKCFSQQTDTTLSPTRSDYLKKSKSQKTAAFILLGAGITMIAIAAPGDVSFDALPVLAAGATASILGSIPLFIASSKNKKRAKNASVFLEIESRERLQLGTCLYKHYPAVGLEVDL